MCKKKKAMVPLAVAILLLSWLASPCMAKGPRSAEEYFRRGLARYAAGDLDGAIADYTRAIEIDPQNAAAFNNRGNAYDARGELEKARNDFDRAVELNSNLPDAYMNRGLTLIRQGKDAEAEQDFARYLRLTSGMKDTLDKLVRLAKEPRQQ